jgi:raffinose/stachyose/melibiose transport system substrate-binding protein
MEEIRIMSKARRLITLALLVALMMALQVPQPAKAQPVVLKMWHIATEADAMGPLMNATIERFNKANEGKVQIEAQSIENDAFKTQLQVAVSAGEQPDIFQTWGGGLLQSYVEQGIVREIKELSGDAGKKFSAGSLAPATFDGKHYAVPANLAGVFLWTNVDMFKANNLALPDTWENFIAACKGLKAKDITPVQLGNKDKWPGAFWLIYLATRIGGPEAFSNAFNRVNGGTFEDPAFVKAGAAIQEAVNAGCFEEGYNGTPYDQSLIGTELAAMQLQGDWNLGGLKNLDAELTAKSLRPLAFPVVKDGKGKGTDMVGGTGMAFAVSVNAPKEAEAAIIELMSNDEYGQELAKAGYLPALIGYDKYIEDPIVQSMGKMLGEATYMQLYYDQFLPPVLAQVHLETTQQLFGLSTTPEEAAKAMEEAAVKELDMEATMEATP